MVSFPVLWFSWYNDKILDTNINKTQTEENLTAVAEISTADSRIAVALDDMFCRNPSTAHASNHLRSPQPTVTISRPRITNPYLCATERSCSAVAAPTSAASCRSCLVNI